MATSLQFTGSIFALVSALAGGASAAATVQKLYTFPESGLAGNGPVLNAPVFLHGKIYGTTDFGGLTSSCKSLGCGTVFMVDPATGSETVLHAFAGGKDGALPMGTLVAHDGVLYGTTTLGGGNGCRGSGCGTIYRIDALTGKSAVRYAFTNGADGFDPTGLTYNGGILYGASTGGDGGCGTVFGYNLKTGRMSIIASVGCDIGYPLAAPAYHDGMLYLTSETGPATGSVFSVNASSGATVLLHSFTGGADGGAPYLGAGVIYLNGVLYGTTQNGASGHAPPGDGVVFAIDTTAGAETVLHTFKGGKSDGSNPFAGVTAQGGALFGTTNLGGNANGSNGTVFTVDLATGTETVLYDMDRGTGIEPAAALTYENGSFYGFDLTSVFKLTP